MVQGMKPPVAPPKAKPQPKPEGASTAANPIPEFMWCQRSDRVYLTIKVADCVNAAVDLPSANVLEFRGTGHGMCGQREYRLNVTLAADVVPDECAWFISGPNVRVRLQKAKTGPYWASLLAEKRKMAQLKVDWASWLDEDEEHEASAAPKGFEANEFKGQMMGSGAGPLQTASDPLYRDLDRFDSTTTPDEGEEQNSIMIDEGMNSIDDLQIKFRALDYEKEQTALTKQKRYELRKATREAVLFQKQRENDLKYGRPTRDMTERELSLIANEAGLYEKLKAEKKQEKLFWLSKWWHQRRPEKRKIDLAEPMAREAAVKQIAEELDALKANGGDVEDAKVRRGIERRVFIKARAAAIDKFNQWEHQSEKPDRIRQDQEGRDFTARDMGAKITREELAKALGEPMPDLAQSLRLKQFADPRPDKDKPQLPEGYGGASGDEEEDADDEDEEIEMEPKKKAATPTVAAAAATTTAAADDDEDVELELEANDGLAELALEENDGDAVLELEDNDGGDGGVAELALEENDGDELELEDN